MHEYRVLKEFPSRNGAKNYEPEQLIWLRLNTRTRALVDLGYIQEHTPEMKVMEKACIRAANVYPDLDAAIRSIKGVKMYSLSTGPNIGGQVVFSGLIKMEDE